MLGQLALMDADAAEADLVLWLGISFEQSASVGYFRRIVAALQRAGRSNDVPHCIVNPSDDAMFNVQSAVSNSEELRMLQAVRPSDELFEAAGTLRAEAAS